MTRLVTIVYFALVAAFVLLFVASTWAAGTGQTEEAQAYLLGAFATGVGAVLWIVPRCLVVLWQTRQTPITPREKS